MTKRVSKITGEWLAGFTDGEGCFLIKHDKRIDYYIPLFRIKLREDDKNTILSIIKFIGAGKIYKESKKITNKHYSVNMKPCLVFSLTGKECLRVVKIFDICQLKSKKLKDYNIWRKSVILYTSESIVKKRNIKLNKLKLKLENVRKYKI